MCYTNMQFTVQYTQEGACRRTGLVTFYVETAFYNGLLKERHKGG